MDVDTVRKTCSLLPRGCYQCEEANHLVKDCLHCLDIRRLTAERGKWDVDCDKQIEKAVTAPNCVLKGSWGEGGSGGIRKKLKSEYAAYLESKYRRNDRSSI